MRTKQPHCAFCAFEDWLFESFENVVLTIVFVVVGVVVLSTILFAVIIALAST